MEKESIVGVGMGWPEAKDQVGNQTDDEKGEEIYNWVLEQAKDAGGNHRQRYRRARKEAFLHPERTRWMLE